MPKDQQQWSWQQDTHPAVLYSSRPDGTVQCHLSPRNCVIRPGAVGFCRVRANRGGELVTLNYGKSVAMTEETIETEAVYHYAPGARILSMGNIGCMMNCDYCHNWQTSQARFVEDQSVHYYTPEQVVQSALERGIQVISWTYNDPVVWHEFVLDTARLAREHGLVNLFKSAFYISLEGAKELCEVIDIFSISLKSMDPTFYKRVTKGQLQPVLDATAYVFDRGKHVEVSSLLVTDANDTEGDARKLSRWVLDRLGPDVPVHFVRFHPDYKYTHVDRTPVERLERAREIALEEGVRYCYLGNVYDNEATNSYCPHCGLLVVERYGLIASPVGLTGEAHCQGCANPLPFRLLAAPDNTALDILDVDAADLHHIEHEWRGDVKAVHVELSSEASAAHEVTVRVLGGASHGREVKRVPILPGSQYRFIACKSASDDRGVSVQLPPGVHANLYEVYDRAHFPISTVLEIQHSSDAVPEAAIRLQETRRA
ncbi:MULTISPECIES: AmmeMemoRadiSam system radical SAM enzyme [unclassified Micromonospora]|uniref:AmmeMemoRadiSam system radical SAM enzyme n=1 Tax=unclassified Micromonospora TaxID=2617518 RepID=UPI001C602801|nr:AmmeMemoRadiSam system radical SAM enzyme [Micromonospora sp. RL09-050-HVF-A]MBW4704660.1 AmmeMemoRadiSam system radical SAM enzyme [Micromonospora sp. RL09-050-HVF-A]